MRTAQRIGQIERVWRVWLGWAGLGSIILLVVTPETRDKARIMEMETAGVLVLVTSPL